LAPGLKSQETFAYLLNNAMLSLISTLSAPKDPNSSVRQRIKHRVVVICHLYGLVRGTCSCLKPVL
jgi:hypothetical protein